MSKRDIYEVLGVARDAGADDIKKAYRRLAMQYHPDRNPNDSTADEKFREVNQAYDILKDDQKRAAYDQFGHAAFEQGGMGGGGFGGGGGFANIFEEMFGEFMGGKRGGFHGNNRGSDMRYNLEISLEDAFTGKTCQIQIPSSVPCEDCKGTGGAGGSQPVDCGTCRGAGKVRLTQAFLTLEQTCPTCHGAGKTIRDPCRKCSGSGRTKKDKILNVTIPPGVEDGNRMCLGGEGEPGARGAQSGDLYIFFSITQHRIFHRNGADIQCRVPVTMVTAILGGTIDVPTIDGTMAKISIPAGTQSGHQLRLRGKGMRILNRGQSRGDMFVETFVETPVNISKRQEELLREFDEIAGNETNPHSTGFFAKVREIWQDWK